MTAKSSSTTSDSTAAGDSEPLRLMSAGDSESLSSTGSDRWAFFLVLDAAVRIFTALRPMTGMEEKERMVSNALHRNYVKLCQTLFAHSIVLSYMFDGP